MKKQILFILSALLLILLMCGCGEDTSGNEATKEVTGKRNAEIVVKDYGTITLELDADNAPISTNNFIKLVTDGFYDGLSFHRIISGFMIQGGEAKDDEKRNSLKTIKGEFSSNNVKNPLTHTRGAVSMARTNDPDSASSQFFIVHQDSNFLDGEYAVFGYVTDGIEVVDKICEDTQVQDNNGTVAENDQPIIETIRMID